MAELGAGDRLDVVLRLSALDKKVSGGRSKEWRGFPAYIHGPRKADGNRNEEFEEEEDRKFEQLTGGLRVRHSK